MGPLRGKQCARWTLGIHTRQLLRAAVAADSTKGQDFVLLTTNHGSPDQSLSRGRPVLMFSLWGMFTECHTGALACLKNLTGVLIFNSDNNIVRSEVVLPLCTGEGTEVQ